MISADIAVKHYACPHCGAPAGERCRVASGVTCGRLATVERADRPIPRDISTLAGLYADVAAAGVTVSDVLEHRAWPHASRMQGVRRGWQEGFSSGMRNALDLIAEHGPDEAAEILRRRFS